MIEVATNLVGRKAYVATNSGWDDRPHEIVAVYVSAGLTILLADPDGLIVYRGYGSVKLINQLEILPK